MSRTHAAPVFVSPAGQEGVGVRSVGLSDAYFVDLDGVLHVTTDPNEATHSLVESPAGHYEIAPYRSDSTMILGAGQSQLAPVRVPPDLFLQFWHPGLVGVVKLTRSTPAGFIDADGHLATAPANAARRHFYEDGN